MSTIPIPKPRLRIVRDEYAIAHGKPWCCSQAGFCARGKTPEEAYKALMDHFEDMKRWQVNGFPRRVRA